MVWESLGLKKGEDIIILSDLIRKAAIKEGLRLNEDALKAYSGPIAVYTLDQKLLDFLKERGIKRQHRPDCDNKVFTLVDENPQNPLPGYGSSNNWDFEITKEKTFILRITLFVGFGLNIEKRGIVLMPQAMGTSLSPSDHLPNFRMFKALVEWDNLPCQGAQKIAKSEEGNTVVTWTELGLGGIRRISNLFSEFVGRNTIVRDIADKQEVFVPFPHPKLRNPGDEQFVVEPAQPKVFATWRKQLENYRSCLVV